MLYVTLVILACFLTAMQSPINAGLSRTVGVLESSFVSFAGGALFLGLIAVLPLVVQGMTGIQALSIGGVSILIVVSVVLELVKHIQSQLMMRSYEAF